MVAWCRRTPAHLPVRTMSTDHPDKGERERTGKLHTAKRQALMVANQWRGLACFGTLLLHSICMNTTTIGGRYKMMATTPSAIVPVPAVSYCTQSLTKVPPQFEKYELQLEYCLLLDEAAQKGKCTGDASKVSSFHSMSNSNGLPELPDVCLPLYQSRLSLVYFIILEPLPSFHQ